MKKKRSGGKTIGFILAATVFLLLSFIAFLVTWTLGYWHDITFDEIVFYLSSPLEGTAGNVINAFIFKVVVPTVAAVSRTAPLILSILTMSHLQRRT